MNKILIFQGINNFIFMKSFLLGKGGIFVIILCAVKLDLITRKDNFIITENYPYLKK